MPQERLGYVEMEWECPQCGTRNKGTQKTCANCGYAMGENVSFALPAEQTLITDEAKLAQAKKGADIHCPYCGARNAADAKTCTQCSGDLTKGTARQAGQVAGAFQSGPAAKVKCPACGTENAASASHCQSCGRPLGVAAPPPTPAAQPAPAARAAARRPVWHYIAGGAAVFALVACLCGLVFALTRTTDTAGVVQSVHWKLTIGIEALRDVEKAAWQDQIPADARVGACELKYRETRANPDAARESKKVCGTPYTKDLGNGVSEVVQDCEYEIYDNYCSYTVKEWREVDQAVAEGGDLKPQWPLFTLASGEREGQRTENYTVVFDAEGQTYNYSPGTASDFAQFEPGSRWTLKVNMLGGVNEVEPAR
jgi:membrane protease subunit (stomatin/prohibitin family)